MTRLRDPELRRFLATKAGKAALRTAKRALRREPVLDLMDLLPDIMNTYRYEATHDWAAFCRAVLRALATKLKLNTQRKAADE